MQSDVYEALTGRITSPAGSLQDCSVLAGLTVSAALLSPDAKLLLCNCHSDGLDGSGDTAASLHVLHVTEGQVLASASHAAACLHVCSRCDRTPCMLWHPSSRGLVLSSCYLKPEALLDTRPFQQAGLRVGSCPVPAHVGKGSAFSPSGDLLLAACPLDGGRSWIGNPEAVLQSLLNRRPLAILQCTGQGQEYDLTLLHLLEDPDRVQTHLKGMWCPLPDGQDALLVDDDKGVRLISPDGQALGKRSMPHIKLPEDPCIAGSPCGQFYPVRCRGVDKQIIPLVLHCRTGKVHAVHGLCDQGLNSSGMHLGRIWCSPMIAPVVTLGISQATAHSHCCGTDFRRSSGTGSRRTLGKALLHSFSQGQLLVLSVAQKDRAQSQMQTSRLLSYCPLIDKGRFHCHKVQGARPNDCAY